MVGGETQPHYLDGPWLGLDRCFSHVVVTASIRRGAVGSLPPLLFKACSNSFLWRIRATFSVSV